MNSDLLPIAGIILLLMYRLERLGTKTPMENPKARVHYAVCGLDPDDPRDRADGLLHLARQFLTVGKSSPDTCDFAKYFNVYHAIEAALKSHLSRSGMTDDELRSLGHDITAIVAEAEQRGFALQADEKTVLNGFECSVGTHDFEPSIAMRYLYFGSPSCPKFDNLVHVAEAILSRI
jgi:hypothetical protein